jgi:hypothetical protein
MKLHQDFLLFIMLLLLVILLPLLVLVLSSLTLFSSRNSPLTWLTDLSLELLTKISQELQPLDTHLSVHQLQSNILFLSKEIKL